jgi:prepilin signal peptidase PulO-like enzyme (type II secretory pathway)
MRSEALFVLLVSPFVGSFLGVVILRMPEGRLTLLGRSDAISAAGRSGLRT